MPANMPVYSMAILKIIFVSQEAEGGLASAAGNQRGEET